MRKLSLIVAAVMASVLLSGNVVLANGQPALPSGDKLFEVSCDNSVRNYQLLQLDFENNARVAVGTGTGEASPTCSAQGAILPGTDWFYFIDYWTLAQPLVRVNLESGAVEIVRQPMTYSGSDSFYALAIDSDGLAYVLGRNNLFSVNLTTGALTLIGAYSYSDFEADRNPNGFAYDPMTDKFYVADFPNLYDLDVTTGEATRIGEQLNGWAGSMAFDSSGALWVNGDDNYVSTTTIDGFSQWERTNAFSPDVYSQSLVLVRAEPADGDSEGPGGDSEVLAATGAVNLTMLGLAGALLVGTAVIARRRRA